MKVVVVNKNDKEISFLGKIKAHKKGKLHRAFSIFVFNDQGELLIQKRSKHKLLWPEFWSNTVCSHPLPKEETIDAAQRRLKEEFGFSTELGLEYRFQYYAEYGDVGIEHELCHVLIGNYNGKVKPDKKEIADYKWININKLKQQIKRSPDKFTPWFKKEFKELVKRGII